MGWEGTGRNRSGPAGQRKPLRERARSGADQTVWIVANGLRDRTATRSYGAPPIGPEYRLTRRAYDVPAGSALNHVHFSRVTLIYIGTAQTPEVAHIDSMYLAQWADPDVGHYGDDFMGTDTTRALTHTMEHRMIPPMTESIPSLPRWVGPFCTDRAGGKASPT